MRRFRREGKSKVKMGERIREIFWTARGVRQRCPMSPYLFNLMLAGVEDMLRRRDSGEE